MTDVNQVIVDRKIRFALVGCGRIARNHFTSIKKYSDSAELVGICDIDPDALEVAAAGAGTVAGAGTITGSPPGGGGSWVSSPPLAPVGTVASPAASGAGCEAACIR